MEYNWMEWHEAENDIKYYKSDKEGISKSSNNFLFDNKVINLGLDLQGGKEFLLAPKIDTWLKQLFDSENQNILSDERKALFNALSNFYSSHSNDDATFTLDSLSLYLEKTNNSIKINNLLAIYHFCNAKLHRVCIRF